MAWYRTGTISITTGQKVVGGVGTYFLSVGKLKAGDIFTVTRDKFYEIESVDSDTQLTLKDAYEEATATVSSYMVIANFTSTLTAQLAAQLQSLLTKWHNREDELVNWLAATGDATITDVLGNAYTISTPSSYEDRFQTLLDQFQADHDTQLAALNANPVPAPDKVPMSRDDGLLDPGWIDKGYFGLEYQPSIQPSLVCDFARNDHRVLGQFGLEDKSLMDQVTFTRASTATRVNALGLIDEVQVDTPRIDYDPVTGECKGLLNKEQRTNLLLHSQDFSNAVWVKNDANLSVVPNDSIGLDGLLSADTLTDSGTSGDQFFNQNIAISSNSVRVFSLYVKKSVGDVARLGVGIAYLGGSTVYGLSVINTTTGAIGGGTGPRDISIAEHNEDYWRISIVVTSSENSTAQVRIFPAYNLDGGSNRDPAATGSVTVWGAQLEEGAFPTSYIPTTTAQVTRAADLPVIDTLTPWFNASEGTVFIEGEYSAGDEILTFGGWPIIAETDGYQKIAKTYKADVLEKVKDPDLDTGDGWLTTGDVYRSAGASIFPAAYSGFLIVEADIAPNTVYKVIGGDITGNVRISAYDETGFIRTTVGFLGASSEVYISTPPEVFHGRLYFEGVNSGSSIGAISIKEAMPESEITLGNGHHKKLIYYPRVLPASELQELTA